MVKGREPFRLVTVSAHVKPSPRAHLDRGWVDHDRSRLLEGSGLYVHQAPAPKPLVSEPCAFFVPKNLAPFSFL